LKTFVLFFSSFFTLHYHVAMQVQMLELCRSITILYHY